MPKIAFVGIFSCRICLCPLSLYADFLITAIRIPQRSGHVHQQFTIQQAQIRGLTHIHTPDLTLDFGPDARDAERLVDISNSVQLVTCQPCNPQVVLHRLPVHI
jgi:hypothetical protein